MLVSSTIPANGDVNPYGIAFVPSGFPAGGPLNAGDILVSNFNSNVNNKNLQGTGTTIIKLTPSKGAEPDMQAQLFFQGKPPLGFTLALGVLRRGFVIAGNVTTSDGTSATVKAGPLLFIDKSGALVGQLASTPTNKLNGPWGLALKDNFDRAQLFVSNVLDGTVSRFDLTVSDTKVVATNPTQIASGYTHRTDPAALVVGPAGLLYDALADILYVASTADNAIFAVSGAGSANGLSGKGKVVFADHHLRGPIALALAPNGDLIASNGDAVNADPAHPSEIVEFTKSGRFIGEYNIHQNEGGAFGVAISEMDEERGNREFDKGTLAVVNDNANNVAVTTLILQ